MTPPRYVPGQVVYATIAGDLLTSTIEYVRTDRNGVHAYSLSGWAGRWEESDLYSNWTDAQLACWPKETL